MNIKSKLLMAGSALLFSATMVFGAVTTDQLAAQFQADGYRNIVIKTGLTQIKVEAVKGSTLYEVVYDIATGATIDTSTYTIAPIDTPDPGVIIRSVNRDFEDDHISGKDDDDDHISGKDDDDDEIGDDDDSDHDLSDDDGSDDDSFDDSDDDSDDDHGGSSGSDDDDDDDDDHGGDDGDDD